VVDIGSRRRKPL